MLGPAWDAALGGDLALNTPLRFLAAGYAHPYTLRRLGQARLTRFIWRYSHGAWGQDHATRLLDAAGQTLALWEEDIDYTELAEDIVRSAPGAEHRAEGPGQPSAAPSGQCTLLPHPYPG